MTNYGSLIFGLGLGMVAGNFFRPWAKRIGLLPMHAPDWSKLWTGMGLVLILLSYGGMLYFNH